MSRKGIILALIIFIGLGLYVFQVERKKPVSEGNKELILKIDKDKARRLILSSDGKEIILNKEKDGKWQITSPIRAKADDEVIKGMVDELSNLEASQSLEVNPAEWEDFGLKKPRLEVMIYIGGQGEEKLSFGDKNPSGTSTYTRMRGRDKVFLVSSYLANGFKKEVFDLREKKLLSFEKEKVTGVGLIYGMEFQKEIPTTETSQGRVLSSPTLLADEVSCGAEDIVLEKQGEEWQIIRPVKDKGDKYEIDDLLSNLYDLKAAGFIDEIKEGESYGLDKPELKCIILAGPEKISQTLNIGKSFKEKEKDLQYAQRDLLSTIFKIEASKVNDLKKGLFDLRNKVILSIDRDKIEKIELVYPPGKSLVLERDKDKKWFAAGKEKIELDSDKVNDLLWEITDLKAKGIAAEEIKEAAAYGLDKPEVKVVIKAEAGVEKTVLLGKKAGEKAAGAVSEGGAGDTIYASLAGNPRLFLVEASLASRLKKDLSELKKVAPPAPERGAEVKPASEGKAGEKKEETQ